MKLKTLTICMLVAFFVGILLYIVGAILYGVRPSGDFDIYGLANSFVTIGLIVFILAGVFLIGLAIVAVVRNLNEPQK